MITYTVTTDRSETGAATTNDDALAEALATVLMLHAHHTTTEPGVACACLEVDVPRVDRRTWW